MTKLYANFNFFKVKCDKCNCDLSVNMNLKKLAEQISYECNDLTEESSNKKLSYAFKCPGCNKIVNCNLSIERRKSVLIVE